MIADPVMLADLRSEWAGVVRMRERMKLLVVSTFPFGGITAPALEAGFQVLNLERRVRFPHGLLHRGWASVQQSS